MRLMVSTLIIALLIPLGACSNRVVSEAPWFHEETTTASPKFREGVWRYDAPHCKVKEAEPAEQWPTCADWSYLRGDQSLSPQWSESGVGRNRRRTYDEWSASESVNVSGDPIISQINDCSLGLKRADSSEMDEGPQEDAPATAASPDARVQAQQVRANFCYDAVRPTAFDDAGRITAVEAWPIICGPWPKTGGKVTDRPWQGLLVVGDNCNAANEAALREAARRSRDVALAVGMIAHIHWVRNGYH